MTKNCSSKVVEHKEIVSSGEELILVEQWPAGVYIVSLKTKDAVIANEKVMVIR